MSKAATLETKEERFKRLFGCSTEKSPENPRGDEFWKVKMKHHDLMLSTPKIKSTHELARQGKTSSLKGLIAAGTDIDELDESGNTFLHIACSMKRRPMYEQLVQMGASLSIKNAEGQYALDFLDAEEAEKLRSMAPREEATAACKLHFCKIMHVLYVSHLHIYIRFPGVSPLVFIFIFRPYLLVT
jgi:Ankyrin repeats (many copies)